VNTFGALGDSTVASDSQPVAVYGGHKFTSVSTGGSFFSCGRAVDAEIWCWGHSVTSDYGIAPTDIGVSADGLFVGQVDACILQSGALKCWGYNSDFQLGNGSSIDAATPTPVITQAPRMRSPVRRP
jgi:hypothetical protein